MNLEMDNNKVYLQGVVDTIPEYNHTVKDEEFFSFDLRVARLSGQVDTIPIIVSKKMVEMYDISLGKKIGVHGQFRSHNKIDGERRRLLLAVFAKDIVEWDEEANSNTIELCGYICKPSVYRITPFSREICDVLLAVNRSYNKSDYVPCIAWGSNAQFVSRLTVASPLKILGRIQSREYNKVVGDETFTKVAYEVSISKIID